MELGPLLGRSVAAADHQLRDALDLRHRHPRLWEQIAATARLAVLPGPALTGRRLVQVDAGTGAEVDLAAELGWTRSCRCRCGRPARWRRPVTPPG